MCDIQEKLSAFCQSKKINEKNDLTYTWKKQRNEDVNQTFEVFYNDLHNASNTDELQTVIQKIFDWGGVGSDKLKKYYAEKLFRGDLSFESQQNTPLSSWSKVLAAYTFKDATNPKYFIYDSRVAIALNIIDKEHKWVLPNAQGYSAIFALIKQSQKKSEAKTSYQRYCEALQEKGGVSLERKLFMLAKKLTFNCDNWREFIDFSRA